MREDGHNGVPPHERIHIRQEALNDVHEHWVKGRNEEDGLLGEEGRDDGHDVVLTQTHERVGQADVQVLFWEGHTRHMQYNMNCLSELAVCAPSAFSAVSTVWLMYIYSPATDYSSQHYHYNLLHENFSKGIHLQL